MSCNHDDTSAWLLPESMMTHQRCCPRCGQRVAYVGGQWILRHPDPTAARLLRMVGSAMRLAWRTMRERTVWRR